MTTLSTSTGYNRATGKRGSALMIVMCFAILLMVTSMTLHKMSTQLAFTVGNFRKGAEALAVAEGGVSDMLEKLATDYGAWADTSVTGALAGGTYVVTTRTNGATGCIITSIGDVDGVTRETVLETLGTWRSAWNTNIFGEWGIVSGGFLDVNGYGVLHAGCYAGTGVSLSPGTTIEGNVSTPETVDNKGTIGGTTNEGVEEVEIPTFDFEYFLTLAGGHYLEEGAVTEFKKNVTYEYKTGAGVPTGLMTGPVDGDFSHPSGIICVKGDVKIQNDTIIRGAIVATGEIDMMGGKIEHIQLYGPGGEILPSLMALGGDVKVCSGQTLNGYVYASGGVTLNGGDTVYGGIICHGGFDGRMDWQVYPGDGSTPPGINPAEGGEVTRVRIGAWLK